MKERIQRLERVIAGSAKRPEPKAVRDARVAAYLRDTANLPAALAGVVEDHRQAAIRAAFRADR